MDKLRTIFTIKLITIVYASGVSNILYTKIAVPERNILGSVNH